MTEWLLRPAASAVIVSLAWAASSGGDAIELDLGRDQLEGRRGGSD